MSYISIRFPGEIPTLYAKMPRIKQFQIEGTTSASGNIVFGASQIGSYIPVFAHLVGISAFVGIVQISRYAGQYLAHVTDADGTVKGSQSFTINIIAVLEST